jgi:hypothetical protein
MLGSLEKNRLGRQGSSAQRKMLRPTTSHSIAYFNPGLPFPPLPHRALRSFQL